jgi:hypothetical protein
VAQGNTTTWLLVAGAALGAYYLYNNWSTLFPATATTTPASTAGYPQTLAAIQALPTGVVSSTFVNNFLASAVQQGLTDSQALANLTGQLSPYQSCTANWDTDTGSCTTLGYPTNPTGSPAPPTIVAPTTPTIAPVVTPQLPVAPVSTSPAMCACGIPPVMQPCPCPPAPKMFTCPPNADCLSPDPLPRKPLATLSGLASNRIPMRLIHRGAL